MKKLILFFILIISIVCLTLTNVKEVNAEIDTQKNFYYINDITPIEQSLGWKGIFYNNTNVDGNEISLIINGERKYFDKGFGVHASSTLVYNLSEYTGAYTTLIGYCGVDASKGSNGDLTIEVMLSDDNVTYESCFKTNHINGASEATELNIDVKDRSYLKIVVDKCGADSYDHASFGGVRLLKDGYSTSVEKYNGIKTLDEYDQILSNETIANNITNNLELIYKREFVRRCGYNNIQNLAINEDTRDMYDWLLQMDNLSIFIEAGEMFNGSPRRTLEQLTLLYKEYKDCLTDPDDGLVYKKMMITCAVAACKNIKSFTTTYGGYSPVSVPIAKFTAMKYLYDNNLFKNKEQFKSLCPELIRQVMDAKLDDDEIIWLNKYAALRYPEDTQTRYNGYSYINYVNTTIPAALRDVNNKDTYVEKYHLELGDASLADSFSETRNRIWMRMDCGGVCWVVSGTGSVVNEVYGIPATNMYQPGHDAYLLYKENEAGDGIWEIWNNISGWQQSYTRWGGNTNSEARIMLNWGLKSYNNFNNNNGSYMILAQAALNDYDNLLKASAYNFLANSYTGSLKEDCYNLALSKQALNLDAIDGLYDYYDSSNASNDVWYSLATKVNTGLKYYPLALKEELDRIKAKVTDEDMAANIEIMKMNTLIKASKVQESEVLQSGACRDVANYLLNNTVTTFATFSFSGDNKNKIVVDSYYNDYNFKLRYSLDGGTTFTETFDHLIDLSSSINLITAENDILIGIIGYEDLYKLEILDGTIISTNSVAANDLENRLVGQVNFIEFSTDEEHFEEYLSSTRFLGDVTIYARYMAHDNYLASTTSTVFNFTTDTDPLDRKYINVEHITFISSSSEQNGRLGKYSVDANPLTTFHTNYSIFDNTKEVIIELDEERIITGFDYVPCAGANGKMKNGTILGSIDGINYEHLVTFSDLACDMVTKSINFDSLRPFKYLKVKCLESYGNSTDQTNKFFACTMFNFYEDTTRAKFDNCSIVYNSNTKKECSITIHIPDNYSALEDALTYTFTDNGTYTFEYTDNLGNVKTHDIVVDWLKTTKPTAEVSYSTKSKTKDNVTVTLINPSTDIFFDEGYSDTYTFTKNGTYTFKFKDIDDNYNSITVKVNWIIRVNVPLILIVIFGSLTLLSTIVIILIKTKVINIKVIE